MLLPNDWEGQKPLIVPSDSGASATMVNRRIVPKGGEIHRDEKEVVTATTNGQFDTTEFVLFGDSCRRNVACLSR